MKCFSNYSELVIFLLQEMYCSVECREKAFNLYHEIECKMLPLWGNVEKSCLQRRLLILRAFLRGTKQGSELTSLMSNPEVYDAISGKLDSTNTHYSLQDYVTFLDPGFNYSDNVHNPFNYFAMKEALAIFAGLHHVSFFGNEEKQFQVPKYCLLWHCLCGFLCNIDHYSLQVIMKRTAQVLIFPLMCPYLTNIIFAQYLSCLLLHMHSHQCLILISAFWPSHE